MRNQLLLALAAVSLQLAATAQQGHYIPQLSLKKSYALSDINRPLPPSSKMENDKNILKTHSYAQLKPQKNFSSLHQQLDADIRFLRIDKRNLEWQSFFTGMMQSIPTKQHVQRF